MTNLICRWSIVGATVVAALAAAYRWQTSETEATALDEAAGPDLAEVAVTNASFAEPEVAQWPLAKANAAARQAVVDVDRFVTTIRSPWRSRVQADLLKDIRFDDKEKRLFLASLHSREAAEGVFGKHQAEARVMALRLLKVEAQDGNLAPLHDHLAQLAREIEAHADLPRAADKDLVDMIADYTELKGATTVSADPKAYLAEIEFRPGLVRIYRHGIFLALNSVMSSERYHSLFGFLYQPQESSHAM